MSSSGACLPMVMDLFGLLFSDLWMVRWQKQWLMQKRASRPGQKGGAAPPPGSPRKKKKKPAQGRFYERIFSLRVTLWYLIFQRLNFDHTLAAVVANLRAGGADRLGGRRRKLSRQMRSMINPPLGPPSIRSVTFVSSPDSSTVTGRGNACFFKNPVFCPTLPYFHLAAGLGTSGCRGAGTLRLGRTR